jgi:molecular chaperone DnaJ
MYDQYGMAAFEQGQSTGGGGNPFGDGFSSQGFGDMDLNDIFASFFGGGAPRGAQRQSRSSGPQKGEDQLYRVRINFMDAITGKLITVPVSFDEPCATAMAAAPSLPTMSRPAPIVAAVATFRPSNAPSLA